MRDLENYYDEVIDSDGCVSIVDIINQKAPEDNLCSAISPEGHIVSITGSSLIYTSPDAAMYVVLAAMAQNKDSKVMDVLYEHGLDLVYKD